MKAIGFYHHLPIRDEKSLVDLYLDRPQPGPRDLLVSVQAIAVNPVDTKVRMAQAAGSPADPSPRIPGWDAAGEVIAVGSDVEHYQPGDRVYYAGDINRPGCYAEMQLVDERIVGSMPDNLDYAAAAAIPLTALTAWEALFERLAICPNGGNAGQTILLVGGAGGVGSIAIQMARKLAGLKVYASASRTKSSVWIKQRGAHHVVNHRNPLDKELRDHGVSGVDYILCMNNTDEHWQAMTTAIAPQGHICSIVENREPLALEQLKNKSASFSWEFMFTRSMYRTADMAVQREILNRVAGHVEEDVLTSAVNQNLGTINASNLREAHRLLESGSTIGKIVLQGW